MSSLRRWISGYLYFRAPHALRSSPEAVATAIGYGDCQRCHTLHPRPGVGPYQDDNVALPPHSTSALTAFSFISIRLYLSDLGRSVMALQPHVPWKMPLIPGEGI